MYKRIIALICVLAMSFSMLSISAWAADDYTSSAYSYWDAVVIGLRDGVTSGLNFFYDGMGDVAGKIVSSLSSNICASSDDGLHHTDQLTGTGGKDSNGQYAYGKCKYCGDTFKCYGQDFSDAYNDYVNNGHDYSLDNSGKVILYPKSLGALLYHRFSNSNGVNPPTFAVSSPLYWWLNSSDMSPNTLELVPFKTSYLDSGKDYYCGVYSPLFQVDFPFECKAKFIYTGTGSVSYWKGSSSTYYPNYIVGSPTGLRFALGSTCATTSNNYASGTTRNYPAGYTEYISFAPMSSYYSSGSGNNEKYCLLAPGQYIKDATWYYNDLNFYIEITPAASSITLPGSNTRPTNFIKNIYNISNNTTINNVFNETNNTYIDASTGDTYNVTNWEYNYASRFYSFTYDGSDGTTHTVVITYADDFVTVTDNGTTNYYYYGFDSDPGTGGGGSSGGDSSGGSGGDSSGGGSSSGGSSSGIDYTPAINDIIEKLQALIEQGDANSEYLQKVLDALDSINSNTKDTYLTLLDLLNRVNTGLSYTDDSGKTYTVSELAYYIYRYLQDNLDTKVSGISALLEKILKAIESISPNINVDVDIDGDGEADSPETWFTGFLGKFAFIGTLYDCAKQLVADITNDAASAQAVSAGVVSVADLSSDHAPQATADSDEVAPVATYTNPEVLLNFPSVSWQGVDFGKMSAIDLSWYAPYKTTVDNIVSGFLWLGFLWLLIKRAPGIIQGSAMAESDALKIQDFNYRR